MIASFKFSVPKIGPVDKKPVWDKLGFQCLMERITMKYGIISSPHITSHWDKGRRLHEALKLCRNREYFKQLADWMSGFLSLFFMSTVVLIVPILWSRQPAAHASFVRGTEFVHKPWNPYHQPENINKFQSEAGHFKSQEAWKTKCLQDKEVSQALGFHLVYEELGNWKRLLQKYV